MSALGGMAASSPSYTARNDACILSLLLLNIKGVFIGVSVRFVLDKQKAATLAAFSPYNSFDRLIYMFNPLHDWIIMPPDTPKPQRMTV